MTSSSKNQGAQEEITENHDIEVIEENNLVEMTEDTAVGEESGATFFGLFRFIIRPSTYHIISAFWAFNKAT
ncbi:hypothetical protein [Staphylococcus pseudintermedius]|uniref:hypothetical protein n=1 Tax=Staphylococcus pseudintermedius TaxID=283734 RepID=UPI00286DABA1|nr:hypothetical protein [Staphylococcus pseudintermedius]WMZ45516.1 hypothetical protein QS415_13830 [Staphylococcus pseudintermedius]